jgi:hypothetical protein
LPDNDCRAVVNIQLNCAPACSPELGAYNLVMSTVELRRRIKKEIDHLPPKRLATLAEYVRFLSQPPLADRVAAAEKAIAQGKGVNWRKVQANV